jgi:hypothetical protein
MIGTISIFSPRAALFVTVMIVAMSAGAQPTPSQAQQSSEASAVAAPGPAGPVAGKGSDSTATPAASPRRKRGGAGFTPGGDTSATPVEGQNDLINVLQPKVRQTVK